LKTKTKAFFSAVSEGCNGKHYEGEAEEHNFVRSARPEGPSHRASKASGEPGLQLNVELISFLVLEP